MNIILLISGFFTMAMGCFYAIFRKVVPLQFFILIILMGQIFLPFKILHAYEAVSYQIRDSVVVMAESSLYLPLVEVSQSYSEETGDIVSVIFGTPADLASAIKIGDAADMVIIDDERWMRHLKQGGLLDVYTFYNLAYADIVAIDSHQNNQNNQDNQGNRENRDNVKEQEYQEHIEHFFFPNFETNAIGSLILNNKGGNFGKKSLVASSFEEKLEEAENIGNDKNATIIFSATENSVLAVKQVKDMQKQAIEAKNFEEKTASRVNNLGLDIKNKEKTAITFTYEPLAKAYGFLNAVSLWEYFNLPSKSVMKSSDVVKNNLRGKNLKKPVFEEIADDVSNPVALFQVAVVAGDNMQTARKFLEFLKTEKTKKILEKYGYGVF